MIVPTIGGSDDVLRDVENQQQQVSMDDFLNLLMMQLKNQDPMDPMDNQEFINTLAQFTTLETMNTMARSMSEMLAVQNLLGGRHDLWNVNTDQEYHEEISQLESTQPRVPARVDAAAPDERRQHVGRTQRDSG